MKKRRVVHAHSSSELEAKRSCVSRVQEPTLSNNIDSPQMSNSNNNNLQAAVLKPAAIAPVQVQPEQGSSFGFGLLSNIGSIFAETLQEQISKSVSSIAEIGSALHQQLPNVALSAQALTPANSSEWKQSVQLAVECVKKAVSPSQSVAPVQQEAQFDNFALPKNPKQLAVNSVVDEKQVVRIKFLNTAISIQHKVQQLLSASSTWTETTKNTLLRTIQDLYSFATKHSWLLEDLSIKKVLQLNNLAPVKNAIHPFVFNLNFENLMAHARSSFTFKIVKLESSTQYQGQTIPNTSVPHGIGSMSYANGEIYHGDWFNGKRHGIGYYNFADGNKYIGYWSNDVRHGQGTWYFPDSGIFTGTYENGKRHGFGVYTYKSGNQYYGNWANGKREGHGFYRHALNGDLYDGNWSADTRNGKGLALYETSSYSGGWNNGVKHGEGVLTLKGMSVFTGEFKQGEKNGIGRLEFVPISLNFDYHWYHGEWQADKMHGTGSMLMRTGDVIEANYEQGKRVKIIAVQPSQTKRNMYSIMSSRRKFVDISILFSVQ